MTLTMQPNNMYTDNTGAAVSLRGGFRGSRWHAEASLNNRQEYSATNSPVCEQAQARHMDDNRRRKRIGQGAALGFFSGFFTGGGVGALPGAGIGAVVGTVLLPVPGVGTAIGAAVGAAIGGAIGGASVGGVGLAAGAGIAARLNDN